MWFSPLTFAFPLIGLWNWKAWYPLKSPKLYMNHLYRSQNKKRNLENTHAYHDKSYDFKESMLKWNK